MEAPAIISKTSMKNLTIIGLTPFEKPDVNLMPKLYQAGAYPFLSLGNQLTSAQESLDELEQLAIPACGIYIPNAEFLLLRVEITQKLIRNRLNRRPRFLL